jgi:transposase
MKPYETEFKEQAVKMALEVGAPRTSQDLGVSVNTLYTWMSRAKAHGERAHVGSGNKRLLYNDEAAKYTKRIREPERANQILKEALGFFVVSQKK